VGKVLEPEGRQPLLDALRPPPGFVLDRAVGTSYSLDLLALLTAPLAFALFDRITPDGDSLDVDPIALLESVRRHADQIDIFCQAGQIAPMKEHRPIIAYLERSVHGVVPPNPDAIFHPKVWLLRYRSALGEFSYRFLCLSRNLTFDRCWDTLLRLDGEAKPGGEGPDTTPIADFIRTLPDLAINKMEPERAASLNELADELTRVTFGLPDGFRAATFWPMGHDGVDRWPLEGRVDRLLTISPFLTIPMLARLSGRGRNHVLVSRSESLDAVGSNALSGFGEVLTLSSVALADPEAQSEPSPSDEALAESTEHELQGLHAKCYVADAGGIARVWTGSANATNAAFSGNVEFLVELTGPKAAFGVEVTLGDRPGQPSFSSILEPYAPSNAEPQELTVAEALDRELDVLRRWLASHQFTANVEAVDADLYEIMLRGTRPRSGAGTELPTGVTCRPLTTRGAPARVVAASDGLSARFPGLSFEALTSFFVFTARANRDGESREIAFVVNAELLGAPGDRRQRILASLLKNREELLRFLLMLLSGMGQSGQLAEAALAGGKWAWAWSESTALFEPMVRALARDPAKIDEIGSLMQELMKTADGRSILPEGWEEVWEPIRAAREAARQ
jgi:hypothetical protein